MNEEIMNEIQPVRPKDQFTFSCRQCGACCRNIEGCVMVESLDAYRLARYLRTKGEPIEGIEDFLFRYCEPEPLTEEGFPIYMLKTKAPNGSCIFLTAGSPNNLLCTTTELRDCHYRKQENNAYYHIQAINLPFQNIEFYYLTLEQKNDKEAFHEF